MAEDKNKNKHWGWTLFWLLALELVALAFLIPMPLITQAMTVEREMAWQILGPSTGAWLVDAADGLYREWFIDSGVRRQVLHHVLPTEEERLRSRGMENLGQGWFFPFIEERIMAMFLVIREFIFRVYSAAIWLPFGLAIALPATVDGMMMWRIQQYSFSYASPLRHRIGFVSVKTVPVLLLIIFMVPLPFPPVAYPVVFAGLALALGQIARFVPKRV